MGKLTVSFFHIAGDSKKYLRRIFLIIVKTKQSMGAGK